KENDFIYIGSGAQKSTPLNIPGIEAKGVLDPLEFLFRVKQGQETGIGQNVIIIGGGNTAMDAARTAVRLVGKNGKVTIVYRRTIRQMPADMGEIRAVLDEGVEVIELAGPVEVVVKDGKANALRCIRMKTGEKDVSERLSVKEISGSQMDIPADTIIPAIGQMLNIDFLDEEMLKTSNGSYATRIHGVYIGGDAMRGAATAIKAIGDGRKAAEEILRNAGLMPQKDVPAGRQAHDFRELIIKRTQRVYGPEPVEALIKKPDDFSMVSGTLDENEAVVEAGRCLWCDELCSICTTVCPNLTLQTYIVDPGVFPVGKIIFDGENHRLEVTGFFEIRQKYQILHFADWCNECGNCVTFCPTSGAPFKEKPHVYLDKTAFETEKDGFFAERTAEGLSIKTFHDGQCYGLTKTANRYIFSSDHFKIEMDASNIEIREIENISGLAFEADLSVGMRMKLILEGLDRMGGF
ncbi:MAG: putative selenate reductase subunit YgfK, partial [Deltaproteobacteria bacterium]